MFDGAMAVNRHVVVATVVIMAGGAAHVWLLGTGTVTRTVTGGLIVMFILSVVDLFGGGMSTLASALAMLAMTVVLFTDFLPLIFGLLNKRA
jgi:hypothetical protein